MVIITGGEGLSESGVSLSESGFTVEVFNPHTNHSCRLPDLPGEVGRYQHTLCRDLLCGGAGYELSAHSSTARSCLKLNLFSGVFTPTSVSLVENRTNHLCWDVEGEGGPNLLIGGWSSQQSTELVSPDGSSSSANFDLQYAIK